MITNNLKTNVTCRFTIINIILLKIVLFEFYFSPPKNYSSKHNNIIYHCLYLKRGEKKLQYD